MLEKEAILLSFSVKYFARTSTFEKIVEVQHHDSECHYKQQCSVSSLHFPFDHCISRKLLLARLVYSNFDDDDNENWQFRNGSNWLFPRSRRIICSLFHPTFLDVDRWNLVCIPPNHKPPQPLCLYTLLETHVIVLLTEQQDRKRQVCKKTGATQS